MLHQLKRNQRKSAVISAKKGNTVIVGLGTDIIEIVRIGRMVERHGELFLHRVFTEGEIRYCQRRKESFQHFAGRWAAKEAVMKALGVGLWKFALRDVEVVRARSGQPLIRLHAKAATLATQRGVSTWHLTLTHTDTSAMAVAVALS